MKADAAYIARHCLRVRSVATLSGFYCDLLGMNRFDEGDTALLGYSGDRCLLQLIEGDFLPLQTSNLDFYWKIGITVRDLDRAVAHLHHHGYPVSTPHQFQQIGYMSHLHDPEGFAIELLQHGFEGRQKPCDDGHPIGAQATLAHITLRVSDIAAAKVFCENDLDMRLMSIQPVPDHDFCLYFYAYSEEVLPNPDLTSVDNREWLWSRPYAMLELQHIQNPDPVIVKPDTAHSGFDGIAINTGGSNTQRYIAADDLRALS